MRNKVARCLLAVCMSAGVFTAKAQPAIPREYIEHPGFSVGLNVGISDLWGDIGTQSPIDHYTNGKYFKQVFFMGGIFARYSAHPSLGFRLNLDYGTLYATDEWNEKKAMKAKTTDDDAYQRYLRNQDAKVNVWETSLVAEFFPLRLNSESRSASRRLQPYILAGVGLFHQHNYASVVHAGTKAKKWVDVNDIPLEGEGLTFVNETPGFSRKVKQFQFAAPVGLGLRWDINNEVSVGVEYMYRITTTDRLDKVSSQYPTDEYYDARLSPEDATLAKAIVDKTWVIDPSFQRKPWATRGNKDVFDGYSTFSVMLIYRLNANKNPWWY